MLRGISSSGRALDLHSRGTGIDTRVLQFFSFSWMLESFLKTFFLARKTRSSDSLLRSLIPRSWRQIQSPYDQTPFDLLVLSYTLISLKFHSTFRLWNLAQVVGSSIFKREVLGSIPGLCTDFHTVHKSSVTSLPSNCGTRGGPNLIDKRPIYRV